MKWLFLVLLGCGGKSTGAPPLPFLGGDGDDTAASTDTGQGAAPSPDFCDDSPVLSWENFGRGFVLEACQGCHAATAPNRYGAPEEVHFDTAAQTWELAERVLARAAGDYPSMPPLGGTGADDRLLLEYWLSCGEEGR
jgi:uncharacterized membrane protein